MSSLVFLLVLHGGISPHLAKAVQKYASRDSGHDLQTPETLIGASTLPSNCWSALIASNEAQLRQVAIPVHLLCYLCTPI
ncbi:hypothetical protein BST61_g6697 [Cercospora zeina]